MRQKKKLFFIVMLIAFVLVSSNCQARDELIWKKVDIGDQHPQYLSITESYGGLWIGYHETNIIFDAGLGEVLSVIKDVVVAFKREDNYIILGAYNDNGSITDPSGRTISKSLVGTSYEVIGVCSETLISPLAPIYVLKYKRDQKLRPSDPVGRFSVDFESRKLIERQINY